MNAGIERLPVTTAVEINTLPTALEIVTRSLIFLAIFSFPEILPFLFLLADNVVDLSLVVMVP